MQPICVTGMYDNKLEVKINGLKEGYTDLYWLKESSGKLTRQQVKAKNKELVLPYFTEDSYTFYLDGADVNRSSSMSVTFQKILPADRVDRLWNYLQIEDNTYNNDLRKSLKKTYLTQPALPLSYLLYETWKAIKKPTSRETELFYNLMISQEQYDNLLLGSSNRDGLGFCKLMPGAVATVIVPYEATHINVYEIINGERIFKRKVQCTSAEILLPLEEDAFYELHIMEKQDLSCVLYHIQFNESMNRTLWLNSQKEQDRYLSIVEDDVQVSGYISDWTVQEKVHFLEEEDFNPDYPVFPRIQVTESNRSRAVTLTVTGVNYATASNHTYYVSGIDAEYLQDIVKNNFYCLTGINGDVFTVSFSPENSMIDREALLYIVDENNKIVSNVTRCFFDLDTETDSADYHEKLRKLEISRYSDSLITYMTDAYKDSIPVLQDFLYQAIEDTTVTEDKVLNYLMTKIDKESYGVDKDTLLYELLKHYFSSHKYNGAFFSTGSIIWRPNSHRAVIAPTDKGYVLCVRKKELYDDSFTTLYAHSLEGTAIDLALNRYGKFIVYAISEEDYLPSGFLYVNTQTSFAKTYLVDLEVR